MSTAKTIAVIPARGGSKRIPGKNIKEFCGKPIIAYSIEQALLSGLFDQVLVSTDNADIASVARDYGAHAPFIRPPELSCDRTATFPVIRHSIEFIEAQQGIKLERVCCIYATAPFLNANDLMRGNELLSKDNSLEFAFSVAPYPFPIQRAIYLDSKTSTVRMFQPMHANTRSQDLRESYHDAGQFYWGRRDAFLDKDNIFLARSAPVIIPRARVQDIDTFEDWDDAVRQYKAYNPSMKL
jgi:N-acylneuraminate cytidylyltransferase